MQLATLNSLHCFQRAKKWRHYLKAIGIGFGRNRLLKDRKVLWEEGNYEKTAALDGSGLKGSNNFPHVDKCVRLGHRNYMLQNVFDIEEKDQICSWSTTWCIHFKMSSMICQNEGSCFNSLGEQRMREKICTVQLL